MVKSLLEILTKRRSPAFCKPINSHAITNAIDESIYLISMWNIVNQLGKYDFSRGLVENNLKERQLFSGQIHLLFSCKRSMSTIRLELSASPYTV